MAAAALLSACGGGGSEAKPPAVVTPKASLSLFAGLLQPSTFLDCAIDGAGASARLSGISGMTTDKAGNVYVAGTSACHVPLMTLGEGPWGIQWVRKIDPAAFVSTLGKVVPFSSNETMTASGTWAGLGVTQDGRAFVAQYASGSWILGPRPIGGVFRIAAGGEATFKDKGMTEQLSDVAIASDGRVLVSSYQRSNQTILVLDPDSLAETRMTYVDSQSGEALGVGAIALDANDVLYASVGTAVYRQSAPGVLTLLAGHLAERGMVDAQGAAARFTSIKASGIGVDSKGNVFVADNGHLVRKITPDGKVTTVAGRPGEDSIVELGALPGKLTGTSVLAVGPDDSIYLNAQSAILKLTLE